MLRYLKWTLICFVVLCGLFVVESGFFKSSNSPKTPILLQQPQIDLSAENSNAPVIENAAAPEGSQIQAAQSVVLRAIAGPADTVIIGAEDPNTEDDTGFKLQLELSTRGAAIRKATFTYNKETEKGFSDRNPKNPQPLVVISPTVQSDGGEVLAMANRKFALLDYQKQFPLQNLNWQIVDVNRIDDSQTARFKTTIVVNDTNEEIIKLAKTYTLTPGSYLIDCNITIENQSDSDQEIYFNIAGPGGLGREGFRSDMRNVIGGFLGTDGNVVPSRRNLTPSFFGRLFGDNVGLRDASDDYQEAVLTGSRKQIEEAAKKLEIGYNLQGKQDTSRLLWVAISNKYFTGILRPLPAEGKDYCDWVQSKQCQYHNPDKDAKHASGDESIDIDIRTKSSVIPADEIIEYHFQLYVGPKDRDLFSREEPYRSQGFSNTISFMPCCCCPAGLIKTLAFGILAIMKVMYGFIGNYGVVIIILVFLIRLILHPITKKSQVSMSKMTKLAPKAEEIKKKYANNKAEMNKKMMELYREQGASPFISFLPMMLQMPIWFALWSAVNYSIDLRGAAFLPFWITDLSAPDALFQIPALTLPLLGWTLDSFNLLPIMMGVAFYLQQKLMPTNVDTSTNPQLVQQQKMMKIMLPIMMPLVLYKAPSGVNLYIMSSTFAGVIEQHIIRKHIREKEEAESKGLVSATSKTGGKVKKKKPKPFYKT